MLEMFAKFIFSCDEGKNVVGENVGKVRGAVRFRWAGGVK